MRFSYSACFTEKLIYAYTPKALRERNLPLYIGTRSFHSTTTVYQIYDMSITISRYCPFKGRNEFRGQLGAGYGHERKKSKITTSYQLTEAGGGGGVLVWVCISMQVQFILCKLQQVSLWTSQLFGRGIKKRTCPIPICDPLCCYLTFHVPVVKIFSNSNSLFGQ